MVEISLAIGPVKLGIPVRRAVVYSNKVCWAGIEMDFTPKDFIVRFEVTMSITANVIP